MGTTEYKVSIVIRATDKASKHIKSLGDTADTTTDELEELEDAGEGVSGGFKGTIDSILNVKSALMGMAAVGAAKAIWELGELGAQSIRTGHAFEMISGGTQEATRNLDAMKRATRGAMSEQEMMAHSSRLMQMGLASSSEELEELTTMAVRLGSAMGRDATGSVEDFALMLANQSIPRLDTFGMSAGRARKQIMELQAANESLTREEAFLQVVREQGAEAMERLGEATEDEMLAVEQSTAAWLDLKAALGEMVAPAVATVAGSLATATREVLSHRDEVTLLTSVLGAEMVQMELSGEAAAKRAGDMGTLAEASMLLTDGTLQQEIALERLRGKYEEAVEVMEQTDAHMSDYAHTASDLAIPATLELSDLQGELAVNVGAVAKSFGEMDLVAGEV